MKEPRLIPASIIQRASVYLAVEIDRQDFTWHQDRHGVWHTAHVAEYGRQDPREYGPGVITLSGVDQDATLGTGPWAALHAGAHVVLRVVDADTNTMLSVRWRGHIDSMRRGPNGLDLILSDRLSHTADDVIPPKLERAEWVNLADAIRDSIEGARGKTYMVPRIETAQPVTVKVSTRGDWSSINAMHDDWLNLNHRADGVPYTIRYDSMRPGTVLTEMLPRNTWTYVFGQEGLELDVTEEPPIGAIWAEGTDPDTGGYWCNAYYPDADSATLGEAKIRPLVSVPGYERRLYDAKGNDLGPNPAYDAKRRPRAIFRSFEASKADAKKACQAELERISGRFLTGSIRLTADPQEGSLWQIEPGDRIRIKRFEGAGSIDLYVPDFTEKPHAANGWEIAGTVTTHLGTWMNAEDAKKARQDVRRAHREWNGAPSRDVSNPGWDSESPAGHINTKAHKANKGLVTRVAMPHRGNVVRATLKTSTPAEWIWAAFDRPVTVHQIETILGGNPLTADPDTKLGNDPVRGKIQKELREAGLIVWNGTADSPCGYGTCKPHDEDSMVPLTGEFDMENGFPFRLHKSSKSLYFVSWVPEKGIKITGRLLPTSILT